MTLILSLLSLLLTGSASLIWVLLFRPKRTSEALLLFFLFFSLQVIFQGYFASLLSQLAAFEYWLGFGFLFFAISLATHYFVRGSLPVIAQIHKPFKVDRSCLSDFHNLGPFEKVILGFLGAVAVFCWSLNLSLILNTSPHVYDSLSYWIARIPYFLQQGNFDYLPSNQFWHNTRPKLQTILMIYAYFVSGENENLFQIVNFFSYFAVGISVFHIARILNENAGAIIHH